MSSQKNRTALIPVEQDSIMFYGHELIAVRLEDGRIAAVLRWLCESLQIDIDGQLQRIRRKTALTEGLLPVRVDTPGGPQEMQALTLDVLPGYLFTIDENRVKAEARADVVLFQRECVKALAEHFTHKHLGSQALVPTATNASAAAAQAIIEQIADMAGVMRLMQEHLESLLGLPGQVAETRMLVESLADRQDSTDTRLAAVDARTQRLTPAHVRTAQEMVDRMVRESKRLSTPLTHLIIYGRLKHRFRVGSYKEVADDHFEELMTYLRDELSRTTSGEAPEQGSLF